MSSREYIQHAVVYMSFVCGLILLGHASAENPVTIEVGAFSVEYGQTTFEKEIRAFQEVHPNVRVEGLDVTRPGRFRHSIEDFPRLPRNVLSIDTESGYELSYFLDRDMLVPIDDFLPDDNFDLDRYYEAALQPVWRHEKTWGIPWTLWTLCVVVDSDLLNGAGIDRDPNDWNELLEITERVQAHYETNKRKAILGIHLNATNESLSYLFATLVLQAGGDLFDNGKISLTDRSTVESLQYVKNLLRSDISKTDSREYREILNDGAVRYCFYFVPSFDLAQFENHANFRVIPLPTFDQRVALAQCRRYFAIRRAGSKEEERASWEFVKWMTRPASGLTRDWTFLPPIREEATHISQELWIGYPLQFREAIRQNGRAIDLGWEAQNRRATLVGIVNVLGRRIFHEEDLSRLLQEVEIEANQKVRFYDPIPNR